MRRLSASLYCFDWLVDISRGATAFGNETCLRGPCFGVFFMLLIFFSPGPPFIEIKEARETRMERFFAMFFVRMYVCGNEHSHRIGRHLIDWVRIDTLWYISSCHVLNLDQYVMIVSRFFR